MSTKSELQMEAEKIRDLQERFNLKKADVLLLRNKADVASVELLKAERALSDAQMELTAVGDQLNAHLATIAGMAKAASERMINAR